MADDAAAKDTDADSKQKRSGALSEIPQKVVVAVASSLATAVITAGGLYLGGAFHKVVIDDPLRADITSRLEKDQSFLDRLAADERFRGKQGQAGPQGDAGPNGPAGPSGPRGDVGPVGKAVDPNDLRELIAREVARVITQTTDTAKLGDLMRQQDTASTSVLVATNSSIALMNGELHIGLSAFLYSNQCTLNIVGVSEHQVVNVVAGDAIPLARFGFGAYRMYVDKVDYSTGCTIHIGK